MREREMLDTERCILKNIFTLLYNYLILLRFPFILVLLFSNDEKPTYPTLFQVRTNKNNLFNELPTVEYA